MLKKNNDFETDKLKLEVKRTKSGLKKILFFIL